jgi:hypothetical protein
MAGEDDHPPASRRRFPITMLKDLSNVPSWEKQVLGVYFEWDLANQ